MVALSESAIRKLSDKMKNIFFIISLLGSYFIYKDGMHYWYEVIIADTSHPRIAKDKELRKRLLPSVA